MTDAFPLPSASPAELGLDPAKLDLLCARIEADIAAGHHPGAQVALARHGKLGFFRSFGAARHGVPANDATLWLLYSNTKVITAAGLWALAEEGRLRLSDTIAQYLPGFEAGGKGGITFVQLLTHQAGFPSAEVPAAAWEDAALLREVVCGFQLEWEPGSSVRYHPASAHWVAAAVIRAVTGEDHRAYLRRRIIAPLGLEGELFVGVPPEVQPRTVDMHDVDGSVRMPEGTAAHRAAGIPGGGGYGTARAMAAFYQALLNGGAVAGRRILSPRMLGYAIRNYTGDRPDEYNGMPMHRGLGPHLRGETAGIRGLGDIAHPGTFGHGGVGSSYCWADPASGVSFAFLSNTRQAEEFHGARMNTLSDLAHAAIIS
ncbi:serine hydrolase domain-containing protein [Sediminicoccus rosea]|jgi:CubicO group peptidase (beta-lactamase class C family)|uniref:Serine hydrolase domain-containing protein n=1 Tax=Sediminicoccus rosea TaxID=1225128 RepID=A0ABZ0PK72_9PROT|nr:serine hydrolase domain-containing protein [Sediminicoccus rosea]WPB85525.1 serine hydrolase domain-containing protein [Sediminicoccus rosea]